MRSFSLKHSQLRSAKAKEVESELAHSFDLLAASAFHGHQARKPNIVIPRSSTSNSGHGTSTGLTTMSSTSHSRKSSGASHGGSRGHARKDSWSKSALKTAKSTATAAGLCAFGTDNNVITPVDEKSSDLMDAVSRDGTKILNAGGRASEKRRNGDDDRVVLIARGGSGKTPAGQAVTRSTGISPTPSAQSGGSVDSSAVGIAVSTPSALAPEQGEPILFPDHPYASGASHRYHDMPRASEYAGPHPSSPKVVVLAATEGTLNDVSLRHRLPPRPNPSGSTPLLFVQGVSHPYAADPRPPPQPHLLQPNKQPNPSSMFAQVKSGNIREVLSEEFQYSPLSQGSSASNRDSALGVEEALSLAFRRRSFDAAHSFVGSPRSSRDLDNVKRTSTPASQHDAETWQVPSGAINEEAMMEAQHDVWTPSQRPSAMQPPNPQRAYQHRPHPSVGLVVSHMKDTSPGITSLDSSPQASPRAFGNSDDLDDLFYKPGQSSGSNSINRTPSSELIQRLSSRDTSGILDKSSSRGGSSGLIELSRQLTEDLSAEHDDDGGSVAEHTQMLGRRFGFLGNERPSEDMPSSLLLLPQASSSPPGTTLPLRLPNPRARILEPSLLIPEDVESSRASSLLERRSGDEGTGKCILYTWQNKFDKNNVPSISRSLLSSW